MYRHKQTRISVALILALLLAAALVPVTAAHHGNEPPPPVPPESGTAAPTAPAPPGGTATAAPPPPPPNGTATPEPTAPAPGGGMDGMKRVAPAWPPPGLLVTHAATQVQLAPVGDGLHVYLIGHDGTGHSGPYIPSFSTLSQQHAGVATLWTGSNPGTGKSVTIYYLPAENKIRISTYYPDTQYDVNKPYVFTVDSGHKVVHEQW